MKTKQLFSILVIAFLLPVSMMAQEKGSIIDPRDGREYQTVTIGTQTWMAQNLAYAIKISHWMDENTSTSIYSYNDDSTLIPFYGLYYTWDAAKNACPIGWHLPSKNEFDTLLKFAGNNHKTIFKALKFGGTLGLNLILGGYHSNNGSRSIDKQGSYWTSSKNKDKFYSLDIITLITKRIEFTLNHKYDILKYNFELSVRCIKD